MATILGCFLGQNIRVYGIVQYVLSVHQHNIPHPNRAFMVTQWTVYPNIMSSRDFIHFICVCVCSFILLVNLTMLISLVVDGVHGIGLVAPVALTKAFLYEIKYFCGSTKVGTILVKMRPGMC